MTSQRLPDELLTLPETADRLRVSERTVARMIASGELPSLKVRRRRFVRSASIEGLMKDARGVELS